MKMNCRKYVFTSSIFRKNINLSDIACPVNEICKRKFSISYIHLPPYDSEKFKLIETILIKCCGTCAKYEVINRFLEHN